MGSCWMRLRFRSASQPRSREKSAVLPFASLSLENQRVRWSGSALSREALPFDRTLRPHVPTSTLANTYKFDNSYAGKTVLIFGKSEWVRIASCVDSGEG